MISKLLNRKALKAIRHRRESLIKFMEVCMANMDSESTQTEEAERWSRMYWDAWAREEELSTLEDYLRET